MTEKFYALWGKEDKKFDSNEKLFSYILKRLNAPNENVWDGYYRIENLDRNNDLYNLLKNCLTDDKISFDTADRFYHSIGRGALDFVHLLENKPFKIVDAVVYPDENDIECIFKNLKKDIEIIAYGGGTSVTGGISPSGTKRFTISLDTRNLNTFNINIDSMILESGAGIKGPDLENRLNVQNLTLGHFPESFEYSTVGGWIATNAAGQESNRYGKMKDMVLAVKMISPSGIYQDRASPAESGFFRVADIAVGNEGTFGIITRAWLKIHKKPDNIHFKSYMFRSFLDGIDSIRKEFERGRSPMVSRLSDETETYLSMLAIKDNALTRLFKFYLKERNILESGAVLILMDDKKIKLNGGINLGSVPAKYWYRTRFDRPYLYNELLKHGIVAETIETSVLWSGVKSLYRNVINSFNEEIEKSDIDGMIMCHASHEYTSGTALYFTFLFYSDHSRELNLMKLRNAVMNAILSSGGSISHHHGVGTMLSDTFQIYKGNAYSIIKVLKDHFDPDRLLGPGIIK